MAVYQFDKMEQSTYAPPRLMSLVKKKKVAYDCELLRLLDEDPETTAAPSFSAKRFESFSAKRFELVLIILRLQMMVSRMATAKKIYFEMPDYWPLSLARDGDLWHSEGDDDYSERMRDSDSADEDDDVLSTWSDLSRGYRFRVVDFDPTDYGV